MLWMARERIPAISGCLFHFTVDEWDTLDDLGDELVAGESAPSAYFGESGHLFRFQSGHPSERSDAGWVRMG